MSREARLLAIIAGTGLVAVVSLGFLARQYEKRLPAATVRVAESPASRALRNVRGFVAARHAVRAVAARQRAKLVLAEGAPSGSQLDAIAAYRLERSRACAAHGMSDDDYVAIRAAWRAWRAGEPVPDPDLSAALGSDRDEAEGAGLGDLEAFDDAIK